MNLNYPQNFLPLSFPWILISSVSKPQQVSSPLALPSVAIITRCKVLPNMSLKHDSNSLHHFHSHCHSLCSWIFCFIRIIFKHISKSSLSKPTFIPPLQLIFLTRILSEKMPYLINFWIPRT